MQRDSQIQPHFTLLVVTASSSHSESMPPEFFFNYLCCVFPQILTHRFLICRKAFFADHLVAFPLGIETSFRALFARTSRADQHHFFVFQGYFGTGFMIFYFKWPHPCLFHIYSLLVFLTNMTCERSSEIG